MSTVKEQSRMVVDRSTHPQREPGPIELNRFRNTRVAYSRVGTFMGLPLCLTPEDLTAGEVDVAIIGAPVDTSTGQRGTGWGPQALRTAERYLPTGPVMKHVFTHAGTFIKPFETLTCVDYGDAQVNPMDLALSHEDIKLRVKEVAETGAIPIVLGGDHSIMRPDVMAISEVYGPDNIGVIQFDAHYDALETQAGTSISHGTPVRWLVDHGIVHGKNFHQIGLRGYVPWTQDLEWMQENDLKFHFMAEFERFGFAEVMERIMREIKDGPEYYFLTFDIDVLDPVYAPGTGTPEPGGLTIREAFTLVRRICAEANVIGMDLVEVAPYIDGSYLTALNGLRIIQEAMTGMAMRKQGLTEPHYLDPRTSGA